MSVGRSANLLLIMALLSEQLLDPVLESFGELLAGLRDQFDNAPSSNSASASAALRASTKAMR